MLCPKKVVRRKVKRDVFVYFDNDVKVRAPIDAMTLSRRLGLKCGEIGGTYYRPHLRGSGFNQNT